TGGVTRSLGLKPAPLSHASVGLILLPLWVSAHASEPTEAWDLQPTDLYSPLLFQQKRCKTNFHSFPGIFCPWSGTSHNDSDVFEYSAQNSSTGVDSVEHSGQLPGQNQVGSRST